MLDDLVSRRRACRLCMTPDSGKLINGSAFDFDPPVVSYWAQWLGHPQPRVVIVGQDFSDAGYFERYRGADDPASATNRNLRALLTEASLSPGLPPYFDPETPVYLTNAILCLKQPPMNRPISPRWVRNCAAAHLRPLIERLRPEIVVGMGSHGWRAVMIALDLEDVPASIGMAAGGIWKTAESQAAAVGHCGPLGLVNRRWEHQVEDWRRIGEWLHA